MRILKTHRKPTQWDGAMKEHHPKELPSTTHLVATNFYDPIQGTKSIWTNNNHDKFSPSGDITIQETNISECFRSFSKSSDSTSFVKTNTDDNHLSS
jgi:hypothetical protein